MLNTDEVIILGSYSPTSSLGGRVFYGGGIAPTVMAGNVWNVNGIAPCLMTMEGGNRQPMILLYEEDSDTDDYRF